MSDMLQPLAVHALDGPVAVLQDGAVIYNGLVGIMLLQRPEAAPRCLVQGSSRSSCNSFAFTHHLDAGKAPIRCYCYNESQGLLAWCEDVPQPPIRIARIPYTGPAELISVLHRGKQCHKRETWQALTLDADDKAFMGYSTMLFNPEGTSLITVDSLPTSKLTLWDWRMEDGKANCL